MSRLQANSLLLICALAWGCAFVPQSLVTPFMGPLWFTGLRFILGALLIVPVVWWEYRRNIAAGIPVALGRRDVAQIVLMGMLLCAGTTLQQVGMQYTSVTNAGFLTGLYVPLVPLLGMLLYRRRTHWVVWPAALSCLVGTWLLTGAGAIRLNVGDLWVLATVIPFTLHVLWVGDLAERLRAPLLVAWGQFVVCGVLALAAALMWESYDPRHNAQVFWPLAYMVVISVGVGFTGQVVGQRYARAHEAAIILSAETVFAAMAGALFLAERLPLLGYLGGALIVAGIIAVQIFPDGQHAPAHPTATPFAQ